MKTLMQLENVDLVLNDLKVLDNLSFSLSANTIVTLIGPNGAGKTSLVRLVLGLLPPTRGRVWRQSGLRIGYMPQRVHLDPTLPLSVERFLRLVPGVGRPDIESALQAVGAPHVRDRPLQRISGGEFQRVLLARALLRAPDLLVLDEPAQGVDVMGQAELYRLISELREHLGCAVLMVSHDLHLVMSATDQVICLNQHICCSGRPEQVSLDPAFRALFGAEISSLAIYNHHHDHQHGPGTSSCAESHTHA